MKNLFAAAPAGRVVSVVLLFCWLSGAALFAKGESPAGEYSIGAIYLDTQGYYAGVRAGIQQEAADRGQEIDIIETNARGDVAKESSFINILTSAGIKALILSAVSVDGSVRSLQKAAQAGIPVICYNTCVNEEAIEENVFAYAVGDPNKFGYLIGKKAAAHIVENKIAKPKIAIINCEQYEVCIDRRKGFEAALAESDVDGWEIVSNQEGTSLDKAISVTEQVLISNSGLDIIWGESGGASLGAARAVRKLGYAGKVSVFASDMTAEIAKELEKNDVIKAVVDISGKKMGKLALGLALKAIKNEEIAEKTVQAPIDLYSSVEDAQNWLLTHPDGIP